MPNLKIKTEESKSEGVRATFHKKEDYTPIVLNGSKKPILLHVIQADKLVSKGKAEYFKGKIELEELDPLTYSRARTTPDDEKNSSVKFNNPVSQG